MKKISLVLFSLLTLYSCGNKDTSVEDVIEKGNLSEIKAKKAELSKQQSDLSSKIAKLDEAIKRLDASEQYTLVSAIQVKDSLFKHYVELPGDVATDQNIIIYPEYSGVLLQVLVEEGEQVQKGQILARIDDGGLSSQLAQLETQAALARTTFERQQRLWEQNIGSEIQYLEAKSNFEAVQNSVDQLKSQLGKTVVRAPFSGMIDEKFSDQGEVVAPGQSRLFRLINLSDMYITAAVPESYLGKIKKGTEVMVEIAATGTEFSSQISQVGSFVNPNNRTFEIKVDVPDNRERLVKPNLIATVKLNDYTSENAITIPENTIQKNAAGESVAYVVKPENDSTGVAERRILETGFTYDEKIEILSGIKPGELLITRGAKNIHEGEKVKISN
ncbi:efflux RND transporter periplasmic adaptor subunit [Salinimicrobium flavum]|uniref:Efflux RND transporter periplasmic adaptor subunit n=1 Tax=Salinimicrobium flavum TaxID=1737065 RepID=A0ABW5IY41_9FLAO